MNKLLLIALLANIASADKLICYVERLTIKGVEMHLGSPRARERVSVYYTTKDTLIRGKDIFKLMHPNEYMLGNSRVVISRDLKMETMDKDNDMHMYSSCFKG